MPVEITALIDLLKEEQWKITDLVIKSQKLILKSRIEVWETSSEQ